MIAIFLLICVTCVGVLGVAAITRTEWKRYREWREARGRSAALGADRVLRQTVRPTLRPTPARNVAQPVSDLTGVIARLEESAQFRRVPTPVPQRMPKGTTSPPMARPQMYPVIATAPSVPIAPRRPPPLPAAARRR